MAATVGVKAPARIFFCVYSSACAADGGGRETAEVEGVVLARGVAVVVVVEVARELAGAVEVVEGPLGLFSRTGGRVGGVFVGAALGGGRSSVE